MNKVLIDTNIILDFALERENYFADADKILKLAFEKKIIAFITATTVTNIFYIARKEKGKSEALDFIKSILAFIDIANVDKKVVLDALELDFQDFEDAIQESSARSTDIPIIITRNEKDFKNSKLEIYHPQKFLNESLKTDQDNQPVKNNSN